ncbi:Plant UBX domain-containing protein 3 [Ranunculus cassubicifolius]
MAAVPESSPNSDLEIDYDEPLPEFYIPIPEEYKKLRFPTTNYIPNFLRLICVAYVRYFCSRDHDHQTSEKHSHNIIFDDFFFTVDGGSPRKVDDPQNIPFVQSLVDRECPEEFDQPGEHKIEITRQPDYSNCKKMAPVGHTDYSRVQMGIF